MISHQLQPIGLTLPSSFNTITHFLDHNAWITHLDFLGYSLVYWLALEVCCGIHLEKGNHENHLKPRSVIRNTKKLKNQVLGVRI